MDETGMPLDPKAPKLVFERGSYASSLGTGNKSQVTVVACSCAAGFCLPPMVIWDRKTLAPELAAGAAKFLAPFFVFPARAGLIMSCSIFGLTNIFCGTSL